MNKGISTIIFCAAVLAAFAPFALNAPGSDFAWEIADEPMVATPVDAVPTPVFTAQPLVESFPTEIVHAPSAVEVEPGVLLAAWFGGTRERAQDVGVYLSRSSDGGRSWTAARRIVDRAASRDASGLYVKSIGNPVLTRDRKGRIWLLYVATVGGWSTAWVEFIVSADDGGTWSPPRRLYTVPGWNFSTLVRGAPIHYRDGRIGLPIYHETFRKMSELAVLDEDGSIIDKVRITRGRQSIQPSVVPLDARRAIALMRPAVPPYRVMLARTDDGGRTWSDTIATNLINPRASVAGLRTQGDTVLMAWNDHQGWRANLDLALSGDGGETWPARVRIDESPDPWVPPWPDRPFTVSYPYLLRTSDGLYHLFYSYARAAIEHVTFNQAWLDGALGS
ncbi:MAG: hypothetical protein GY791_15595 [Alphaproteobacteria bacterium]|nr:hypothetical protein [Alphaproteobacteria bacterium]